MTRVITTIILQLEKYFLIYSVEREKEKETNGKQKGKKRKEKKGKRGRDIRKIPRRLFRANAAQGTDLYGFPYFTRNTVGGRSSFFSCPEAPLRDVLFRFS